MQAELKYDWRFWARPNQVAPEGDWTTWLAIAGRGFGKTRMGSEWIRGLAHKYPGCRIALVAETAADARDVMILGDSGIINCDPTLDLDSWSPTNRRLRWKNGSSAWCYNATEPDQLRGPQHHFGWVDELAKFRYMQETWDQLQFGLRLGVLPQVLVTTTPRPLPLIKRLMQSEDTVVTRGSTLDNKANLATSTVKQLYERYGGTRLGRQELAGELLEDFQGALWQRSKIDDNRTSGHPDLTRIVVAVDPSGTRGSSDGGDSIGIVVAGKGVDGRAYVLADRSCKLGPDGWGRRAVEAYHEFKADRLIAERNFGGAMVEHVIRTVDRSVSYKEVTASRGKIARAEPVAALYEQGRVSHVGLLNELEDQLCLMSSDGYVGENSPDRADALVWALTELMITGKERISSVTRLRV